MRSIPNCGAVRRQDLPARRNPWVFRLTYSVAAALLAASVARAADGVKVMAVGEADAPKAAGVADDSIKSKTGPATGVKYPPGYEPAESVPPSGAVVQAVEPQKMEAAPPVAAPPTIDPFSPVPAAPAKAEPAKAEDPATAPATAPAPHPSHFDVVLGGEVLRITPDETKMAQLGVTWDALQKAVADLQAHPTFEVVTIPTADGKSVRLDAVATTEIVKSDVPVPGGGGTEPATIAATGPATGPATTTGPATGPTTPLVTGPVITARQYTARYEGVDAKVVADLRSGLALDLVKAAPLKLTLVNGALLGRTVVAAGASQSAAQTVTTSLTELPNIKARVKPEAIASIGEQLVEYLHQQGLYGVWVGPDEKAVAAAMTADGVAELPFVIHVVRVTSVGGGGDKAIADGSPIRPAGASPTSGILLKDDLDDYLLRLNRFPSRRVDVAVAANIPEGRTTGIDGLALSYLVTTQKPWLAFAQISNTGTKQTNVWRERFGFIDNRLTGHDDILTLDYTTAGFDDTSNALSASYEIPIVRESNPTRVRGYGSFSNFVASDVGLAALSFRGDEVMVGAEVIQPLLQVHSFFLDGVAGFRYEHERVDNVGVAKGTGDFSQPYLGLRFEQSTPESALAGGADLIGSFATSNQASLDNLGRLQVDRNAVMLQGHVSYSTYLEPLFDSEAYQAQKSTLAHEIYISARTQAAFDYRLVPSMEDVVGGLYSVRGYAESVAAGDSIVIGTAEYRLHVPRLFGVAAPGRDFMGHPFRYAPQQPYGRPDWDLIGKVFVDVGQTYVSNKIATEKNQSLVGTGVGMELVLKQNVSIRADWGIALEDVNDESSGENIKAGSNRFHLVLTISY